MSTKTLSGILCNVRIDLEEKGVFVTDNTDPNNEPAFYTTSKRNIAKYVAAIEATYSAVGTKMSDLSDLAAQFGVKTHYYCRMD